MDRRTERRDEGVVIGGAVTRRRFMQYGAGAGAGLVLWSFVGDRAWAAAPPSGVLDPLSIPKYVTAAGDPAGDAAQPQASRKAGQGSRLLRDRGPPVPAADPAAEHGSGADQGLELRLGGPPGDVQLPGVHDRGGVAPAGPRQVDQRAWSTPNGNFLPHLLPVDQTLHWANPPGGPQGRDGHGERPRAVPRAGADRHPPARRAHRARRATATPRPGTCPTARNIPGGYARRGSRYQQFRAQAQRRARPGVDAGERRLPVRQRPARDDDVVPRPHARDDPRQRLRRAGRLLPAARRARTTVGGTLPGPAPALGDPPGREYYEIPIAIQDRSFNDDGALFYPDSRAFFEGLDPSQLQIPFMPDPACGGPSDISPIWNPEFFGNAMVVNGAHLAVPRGRAAALPLPLPERLQLALPDPADGQRAAVLADRHRGRLPAGSRSRSARGAARPGRARRRDRRLHQRARRDARSSC